MTAVIILATMTTVIVASVPLWGLDPVRPADGPALEALFAACSPDSRYQRFFAPVRELPAAYRDALLAGPPERHDAVLARAADGTPAGLASLAADPGAGPESAELGVLVADAWQGRGVAAAMVAHLYDRARRRGVQRVRASVLPSRSALLGALARRLEPERHLRETDCLTGVYKLDTEAGAG